MSGISNVSTPKGATTEVEPPQLIQVSNCRPRCGKCGGPVNAIYARCGRGGLRWSKIGYACLFCGQPFVDKKLIRAIGSVEGYADFT